jgi:hypothetical protein
MNADCAEPDQSFLSAFICAISGRDFRFIDPAALMVGAPEARLGEPLMDADER